MSHKYVTTLNTINSATLDANHILGKNMSAVVIDDGLLENTHIGNVEKIIEQVYQSLHPYGLLKYTSIQPKTTQLEILIKKLRNSGFQKVTEIEQGKYVAIYAIKSRETHSHDNPLSAEELKSRVLEFHRRKITQKDVSYIITVKNEAANLPHLLSFMENITDYTLMNREFIFVLNGCTDNSKDLILKYASGSKHDIKVISSTKIGIVPAFKAGIKARKYDGLVGRFDADIILHPHTLDLMQMHLLEHPDVKVTYAEPQTFEPLSDYNEPWHVSTKVSKRLYYVGKTSLYQQNPFYDKHISSRPSEIIADDVFTSFYFVYYFGFDSISRTPNAIVYEKVANGFDDLVKQLSRISSEIQRIFTHYPEFEVLNLALEQELYKSRYRSLTRRALRKVTYVDGWTRLESTK